MKAYIPEFISSGGILQARSKIFTFDMKQDKFIYRGTFSEFTSMPNFAIIVAQSTNIPLVLANDIAWVETSK